MAPPAKRQKRNTVPASQSAYRDDHNDPSTVNLISSSIEEDSPPRNIKSKPLTKATIPRPKTATQPFAAPPTYPNNASRNASRKSLSTSPEKAKGRGKSDKVKSGNLYSFFSTQVQRQQSETPASQPEIDEGISDDDVPDLKALRGSIVGTAAKKRSQGTTDGSDAFGGSQRFLKKPAIHTPNHDDMRPWAEQFAPVNLEELAVHKKKVADVRGWLEAVMGGRIRQRLLVLKGAAGTGKTTTVRMLAAAMDCQILEWRNPVSSMGSADGPVSMAAQFEEFMGRGGTFGQLDIFSGDQEPHKPDPMPLDRRKSIILIEEFPNTFTRSSSALQSFRSSVIQYLAMNTPALATMYAKPVTANVTPLIMVISETLLTTSNSSADSFTAHRLLGPEILQHPGVGIIEFNAIAPTFLAKALDLIVLKESRKSGRRKTPGPQVLKQLGEVGDIRSAIGSLEFLCVRGEDGDWGAKVQFGKGKKAAKDTALTKMEQASLELVTRRESSLGMFHAVGRVVYNKRDETAAPVGENLPSYISHHARPIRSQVSVDQLIDETGTDTQTFVAALHENYVLSCDASPSSFEFSDLDHVNGCIDALSDSDLLCPSWDGPSNMTGLGGGAGSGSDILRQDEISFHVAVRGILFSLPNPVKRHAVSSDKLRGGRGGGEFKMFYPTSLKLWRMKEEIASTVDLCITRLVNGGSSFGSVTSGASKFAKPGGLGNVETWKSSRDMRPLNKDATDETVPSFIPLGTSAKKEMLLERLPYMVAIAKGTRGGSTSFMVREMEKVTAFTGIGGPSEESADEGEDEPTIDEWATDKPTEGLPLRNKSRGARMIGTNVLEARFAAQQIEQKLVLSDDDIEDD